MDSWTYPNKWVIRELEEQQWMLTEDSRVTEEQHGGIRRPRWRLPEDAVSLWKWVSASRLLRHFSQTGMHASNRQNVLDLWHCPPQTAFWRWDSWGCLTNDSLCSCLPDPNGRWVSPFFSITRTSILVCVFLFTLHYHKCFLIVFPATNLIFSGGKMWWLMHPISLSLCYCHPFWLLIWAFNNF